MQKFFESGKTILFVSHSAQQINQLCHRAILLDKGEIIDQGNPSRVTSNYQKLWSSSGEARDKFRENLVHEMNAAL